MSTSRGGARTRRGGGGRVSTNPFDDDDDEVVLDDDDLVGVTDQPPPSYYQTTSRASGSSPARAMTGGTSRSSPTRGGIRTIPPPPPPRSGGLGVGLGSGLSPPRGGVATNAATGGPTATSRRTRVSTNPFDDSAMMSSGTSTTAYNANIGGSSVPGTTDHSSPLLGGTSSRYHAATSTGAASSSAVPFSTTQLSPRAARSQFPSSSTTTTSYPFPSGRGGGSSSLMRDPSASIGGAGRVGALGQQHEHQQTQMISKTPLFTISRVSPTTAATTGGGTTGWSTSSASTYFMLPQTLKHTVYAKLWLLSHHLHGTGYVNLNNLTATTQSSSLSSSGITTTSGGNSSGTSSIFSSTIFSDPPTAKTSASTSTPSCPFYALKDSSEAVSLKYLGITEYDQISGTTTTITTSTTVRQHPSAQSRGVGAPSATAAAAAAGAASSSSSSYSVTGLFKNLLPVGVGGGSTGGGGGTGSSSTGASDGSGGAFSSSALEKLSSLVHLDDVTLDGMLTDRSIKQVYEPNVHCVACGNGWMVSVMECEPILHHSTSDTITTTTTTASAISSSRLSSSAPSSSSNKSNNLSSLLHSWHQPQQQQQYDAHPSKYPSTSTSKRHLRGSSVLRLVSRWNVRHHQQQQQQQGDEGGGVVRSSIAAAAGTGSSSTSSLEMVSSLIVLPTPIVTDASEASLLVHSPTIHGVFVDPTGHHTLVSATNGELYHIHSSSHIARRLKGFGPLFRPKTFQTTASPLSDDKGASTTTGAALSSPSKRSGKGSSGTTFAHSQDGKNQEKTKQRSSSTKVSMNFQRGEFVTCVGWDAPSNITDHNTKRMLLGTNRGRIYEYQIRLTTKTKGGLGKHNKAKTSSSAPTSRRSSVEDGFTGGTLPPIIPSSKTSTNPFENDDEDDDDDDDDEEDDNYDDRVLLFEEIKAAGKQKGSSSSAAAAATTSFSSLARMKQQGGPLLLMDMNTFIVASSSSKKDKEEEKATAAMDAGSTTMMKVSGLHFERLSGGRIMVVVLTTDNNSNTIASPVTRYISSSAAVASSTATNTMLYTFCSAPNNPTLRGAFDLDAPLSQHSSIDLSSSSSSSSSSSATTAKGGGGALAFLRDERLRLCRTQGILLGSLMDHTTTTGGGTSGSSSSAGTNTFFAFDAGPSLGIYCGVLDTKYVTSSGDGNLGGQSQQRMLKETALIPYPRKRKDDSRTVRTNDNNDDETIVTTTTATQLCSLAVTPHHVITVNKKGMVHFIDRVSRQIVQTEHLPSSFLMFGSGVGGGPAASGSSVGVRGHNHHHLHGSMEFCMDIRYPNQIWLRHGRNFMLLSTSGSINEDRDIWKSRIEHGLLMGAPMVAAAAAVTSKSSSNYYMHSLATSATTSYNMIQKILAEFDMAKTSLGSSSSISDGSTSRDDHDNEKRWKRMLIDYVRGEYLLRAAAAAGASSSSVARGGEVATATTTSPTDLVEEAASYLSEAPSLLCPFDKTSLRLGLPSTLLSVGQNDPMLNRISYFDGYERSISNENENGNGTDEDHRRRPYYYEEDPVLMEHALQSYITEKLCRGISDRDSVACAMLSAWLVELQLLSSSTSYYGNSNDHYAQGLSSSRREGRNNRTSCFYPEEENILLDAYSTGADGHYRDRYLVGNKHSHDGDDDDANNEQRSSMMLESFLSSLNITQQQQQQQQPTEQKDEDNEKDDNGDITGMFDTTMEHGTHNIIGVDDCQTTIKILQSYDVKASVCAPYASEAALSKGLLAATGGTSSSSRRTKNSGGTKVLEGEDHHQGGILTGGSGMITVGRGDLKSAIDAALHARPGKDGAKDALRLLERTPIERGEPFYYKYAYQLLCRAPKETCQSLLKQYSKKQPQTKINAGTTAAFSSESSFVVVGLPQPTKLLPSLMAYDNRRRQRKKQQKQKADRERRNKWRNKKGSLSTNINDDDEDGMMDDYLLYGDDDFVVEEGGSQSIIEYLEGVLQAGCPSAAISNYLVSLYAESRDEEPLFEFLRREQQTDLVALRQQKQQQQQQQQQSRGNKNEAASAALSSSSSLTIGSGSGCRLDRSYALRRILKTGRHFRSAVKLFMDFGLRPQAVELALKVDPALARELAKDTPSSIMSKEERKRLWLMIVQNAAADTTASAASSSLSSYNYSTSLSKSSTGGGGGSGGASDSNISESKTSDSNLSTSKKDLELKTGKEVVAKVVAVLKECGPDILSIEDALPFLPDFAQIDEIKDEICNALTSYSSKIDDYMQEIKESQESCNKLREEIHRLETYQMHVNPRATCALSHKRILVPSSPTPSSAGGSNNNSKDDVLSRLEPFYVFPSGYVCLEGPLKKEVLPRLSLKQRQRVDVIEQELKKVRSKVESGQIPVLPASMKEHVNKLQVELNGLIAAECPLTGSGMVDSLDAPFANEQSDSTASDQPRPFQSFFF